MKNVLIVLTVFGLSACGSDFSSSSTKLNTEDSSSDAEPITTASFSDLLNGIDMPTDAPIPLRLQDKKVLVLSYSETPHDRIRIPVDMNATLSKPLAGIDYPTDAPIPEKLIGKEFLVFSDADQGTAKRILIDIEKAKAGIDYPTDGPADLFRDFLVWSFAKYTRIDTSEIISIEKAKAGIDYPTDGPSHLDRDFYVVVSRGSDGFVRSPIE